MKYLKNSLNNQESKNLNSDSVINLFNISKHFPGVQALDDVTISIKGGEILAIVGENGAGKTTLMKIMAGIYPSDSFDGTIELNGEIKEFSGIKDAESAGIILIPQEIQIVPEMNVVENIFLNREEIFIDKKKMVENAKEVLQRFGLKIDPNQSIKNLGVGQQQLVLLARAIIRKAKFVIFDEPTSALGVHEVEKLFSVIRELKTNNVGCVFVSHKIDEVLELSDRVVVLRNGKFVSELKTSDTDVPKIVHLMIGRDVSDMYRRKKSDTKKTIIELQNYSIQSVTSTDRKTVQNINLKVREGEIVSLFGLVGSGRTELISSIMGVWPGLIEGKIFVYNDLVRINTPKEAIDYGIALLTEDRRRFGLFLNLDVKENINIGSLEEVSRLQVIDEKNANSRATQLVKQLNIKTRNNSSPVINLSGGNQQKVLIARLLALKPRLLILDEPTKGIDIGAKAEIIKILNDLKTKGLGILLISSEALEALGISDSIYVMYKGKITKHYDHGQATEQKLLEAATGGLK